jgi:phosphatidylethanolamine-binding protein (PEBP) family uncharacterized protein
MEVFYNSKFVTNNVFLNPSETQIKPEVKYSFENNKLYTLLMHDPDSVYGNRFHWIVTNIINDVKNGEDVLLYTGPAPPPKTGTHRYIFELYEQSKRNDVKIEERNISMNFVKKILNIREPISKFRFISRNESGGRRTKRSRTKGKRTNRSKSRRVGNRTKLQKRH